jgi:hypothetical protein
MTRFATGWAIFQGLLIEALPFFAFGRFDCWFGQMACPPVHMDQASASPSTPGASGWSIAWFRLAGL